MLFNSYIFILFFLPVTVSIYFLINKIQRFENRKTDLWWLFFMSLWFYGYSNPAYLILILSSICANFFVGKRIAIERIRDNEKTARNWMIIGIIFNLALIFYFKYYDFFISNMNILFREDWALKNIVLPLGISFFTFQQISYVVDCYREKETIQYSFIEYAAYVTFFPQLVAGPIERSKNLLKQLANPPKFDGENIKEGIWIMIYGYFLKVVLADRVAIFVDQIYGNYAAYEGLYLVVATLLFAIQLYCDFYGYSTIAVGTARLLGYQLIDNFNAPFYSRSIAELWRRWHISLNTWFRDYLYIPLGGNRKGKVRQYINKVIVFFVSGLWHGANWTFVIWGMLNGIYQMIGEALMPVRNKLVKVLQLDRKSFSHKLMQTIVTFVLFAFSGVFFRASDMQVAMGVIKNTFATFNPWILVDGSLYTCGLDQKNFTLMLISIAILFVGDFFKYRGIKLRKIFMQQEWWFRWLVMSTSVVLILLLGIWGTAYNEASFIYFQF